MSVRRGKLLLKPSDLWFFNYSRFDDSEMVIMNVIIYNLGLWDAVDLNTQLTLVITCHKNSKPMQGPRITVLSGCQRSCFAVAGSLPGGYDISKG